MEEDPYKEYKLWQKNLSNEYQNKLEPMWNRLITFNNREYGIIGFFLYKFEIKDSAKAELEERGYGYGTKIIKEILDNNICNYLVIKNIADSNSLRFWNRIRDNIDYYILPNSNKIRKNIFKLCKRNEWWEKEWNKDNILIFTSKNIEKKRCSKYKKQSRKCRKNQCWYNYKSKKCIPNYNKLTMNDRGPSPSPSTPRSPTASPKYMSPHNESPDPFDNYY